MTDKPRILIYDIETTPILQWRFTSGKDDGRALRTDQDSYVISVAWNWYGEDKIHVMQEGGHPNDYDLVLKVWDLFDEADVLVAHNNDRFDMPKMNTRFVYYGLGPPSPSQTVDTLKVARYKFAHHSNSLDALAQFLGLQEKQRIGIELWFRCMEGDPKALKAMAEYNKKDVQALRDLYVAILPWIDRHPNVGAWQRGTFVCTNCGSDDLQKRGFHHTRVNTYQRYRCNNCGFHPRERKSERAQRIQLT